MKREVKFRSFYNDKSMLFSDSYVDLYHFFELKPEDYPLMQFTGLKDKNGVDIYEGDIVKYKEWENNSDELAFKTNYIVCFEQLKWILKHTSGRYQVTVQQKSGLDCQSLNNDGCKARNFKVIGNIYENTNLLQ